MSVRQLEYAVCVAEHGSVSGAAVALNVSQPALSVAIAGLEEHLGKPLFIRRRGSPVIPTSFGRGFIDEAKRVLTAFEQLVQSDGALVEARPMVIGCFEDLAPIVLGPVLARVRQDHPGTVLSARVGGFEWLSREMLGGRLDFAITYDLGLDRSFDREEIARLRPRALVGAGHRWACRDEISLEDLASEPLVLTDQGPSIRHIIGLFQRRALSPDIAHRAATLEIMRSLVANGLGAGVSYTLPRSSVSYDGKTLNVLAISDRLPLEPVVITSNRLNPLSENARRVMDKIAAMQLF